MTPDGLPDLDGLEPETRPDGLTMRPRQVKSKHEVHVHVDHGAMVRIVDRNTVLAAVSVTLAGIALLLLLALIVVWRLS